MKQHLAAAQVEVIRTLYVTTNLSQTDIARRFGISVTTANKIVNQKTHALAAEYSKPKRTR